MGCWQAKDGDSHFSIITDRNLQEKGRGASTPPIRYSEIMRFSTNDCTLYSDFSEEGSDNDTDYENEKITLKRNGYSKNMFDESIIKEVLKFSCQEVQDQFNKYGPFKIKPKDVPQEIIDNMPNIEYIKGVVKISPHEYYCGEWLIGTNLKHGRGIYCYKNKNLYEGFWVNNRIHGKGRMISKNYIYQGSWIQGEATGRGIVIDTKNNTKYKGTFKNFRPHGKWVEKMKDKYVFKGIFNNGVKKGSGEYKYENGDSTEDSNKKMNGRKGVSNNNGKTPNGERKDKKRRSKD